MNRLERRIKEKAAPLVGMAVYSYNPTFVEMMGLMEFDVASMRLGAQNALEAFRDKFPRKT